MRTARLFSLTLYCLVGVVGASVAADRAIKKDYPVTRITERIYVIYGPYEMPNKQNQGFRNNPAFVVTGAGVIVIDPGGGKNVGEMVLKKIRAITDKPVVAVFDWNEKGGVLHWTHRDPNGSHVAGWLQHQGQRYQ